MYIQWCIHIHPHIGGAYSQIQTYSPCQQWLNRLVWLCLLCWWSWDIFHQVHWNGVQLATVIRVPPRIRCVHYLLWRRRWTGWKESTSMGDTGWTRHAWFKSLIALAPWRLLSGNTIVGIPGVGHGGWISKRGYTTTSPNYLIIRGIMYPPRIKEEVDLHTAPGAVSALGIQVSL